MSAPAVLVTGGSRGIGRAITEHLVSRGVPVCFTWVRDGDAAAALLDHLRTQWPGVPVEGLQFDVGDPAAVERGTDEAIERMGAIQGLVNNAGIVRNQAAVLMDDAMWADVIRTNLSGPFYVTRALLMHFVSRRQGAIVNIGSVAAGGCSGGVAYAAAKAGLEGFSNTIAREYGPRGIRCNTVRVGYVETDLTAAHLASTLREYWATYAPLRRVATAAEVASTVGFLLSDAASFINGEVLSASGGLTWVP